MNPIKKRNMKCEMSSFLFIILNSSLILFAWSACFLFQNCMASPEPGQSTIVNLDELLASDKSTTPHKKSLRYGFHRTKPCNNFEKAFLCVQKCLDLGYDIAHADKKCVCTCFRNKIKAEYAQKSNVTKWRLGAPTTNLPLWAQTTTETLPPDETDEPEADHTPDHGGSREVAGNETASHNDTAVIEHGGEGGNTTAAGGDAAGNATVAEGGESPAEGGESAASEGAETHAEEEATTQPAVK